MIEIEVRKNNNYKVVLGTVLISFFLISCDKYEVFDQKKDFESKSWHSDSTCNFDFVIEKKDERYNLVYITRNSIDYQFSNLYIKTTIKDDQQKIVFDELQEIKLMDEKTGEPYGKSISNIYDHKNIAAKGFRFPHEGKYHATIRHYMRTDPLREIYAFGLHIEITKPEN